MQTRSAGRTHVLDLFFAAPPTVGAQSGSKCFLNSRPGGESVVFGKHRTTLVRPEGRAAAALRIQTDYRRPEAGAEFVPWATQIQVHALH